MPSTAKRKTLLTWFLAEDFSSHDSVEKLLRLTGRTVNREGQAVDARSGPYGSAGSKTWWVWERSPGLARDMVTELKGEGHEVRMVELPPGEEEQARHALHEPTTRAELVRFYEIVRVNLRLTERSFAKLGKGAKAWIRPPALQYLADVQRTLPAAPDGHKLAVPLRYSQESMSLVGELARAMFDQLTNAGDVVICPAPGCDEVEIFPDQRHRVTCSKTECRAWYRADWMRRHYAAEKARKRQGRGKARKR